MLIKTDKLIDQTLDYAVSLVTNEQWEQDYRLARVQRFDKDSYQPSTDQALGAQIIDDAGITTTFWQSRPWDQWEAYPPGNDYWLDVTQGDGTDGPTRLIAGLREVVRLKFGKEIDIPEALCQKT